MNQLLHFERYDEALYCKEIIWRHYDEVSPFVFMGSVPEQKREIYDLHPDRTRNIKCLIQQKWCFNRKPINSWSCAELAIVYHSATLSVLDTFILRVLLSHQSWLMVALLLKAVPKCWPWDHLWRATIHICRQHESPIRPLITHVRRHFHFKQIY